MLHIVYIHGSEREREADREIDFLDYSPFPWSSSDYEIIQRQNFIIFHIM